VEIDGRKEVGSSVHLLTYDIGRSRMIDHGVLMGPDDRRVFFTESIAIGPDDLVERMRGTRHRQHRQRRGGGRDRAQPRTGGSRGHQCVLQDFVASAARMPLEQSTAGVQAAQAMP